jgi:putative endonuclease
MSYPDIKGWRVYILLCRSAYLYTGINNDIGKRLKDHEQGTGSRFVHSHLPFRVIRTIPCSSDRAARSLEYRIKKLSRKKKMSFLGLAGDHLT